MMKATREEASERGMWAFVGRRLTRRMCEVAGCWVQRVAIDKKSKA
jgi:hypothetical protein